MKLNQIMLGLIGAIVLLDLYVQYARYETNWCEAEVQILREQVSDIWQYTEAEK